jgi:hypothetical protein
MPNAPLLDGLFGRTWDQLTPDQQRFYQAMSGAALASPTPPTTQYAPYEPSPVNYALRNWQYLPDDQQMLLRSLGVDPSRADPQDYVPQHPATPSLQQAPGAAGQWFNDLLWYSQFAVPSPVGATRLIPEMGRSIAETVLDQGGQIPMPGTRFLHATSADYDIPRVSEGWQNLGRGHYVTDDPRVANTYADWRGTPESGTNVRLYDVKWKNPLDIGFDADPSPTITENLLRAARNNPEFQPVVSYLEDIHKQTAMSDDAFVSYVQDLVKQDRATPGNTTWKKMPSRKEILGRIKFGWLHPSNVYRNLKQTLESMGRDPNKLVSEAGYDAIAAGHPGGTHNEYVLFDPATQAQPWFKKPE